MFNLAVSSFWHEYANNFLNILKLHFFFNHLNTVADGTRCMSTDSKYNYAN